SFKHSATALRTTGSLSRSFSCLASSSFRNVRSRPVAEAARPLYLGFLGALSSESSRPRNPLSKPAMLFCAKGTSSGSSRSRLTIREQQEHHGQPFLASALQSADHGVHQFPVQRRSRLWFGVFQVYNAPPALFVHITNGLAHLGIRILAQPQYRESKVRTARFRKRVAGFQHIPL